MAHCKECGTELPEQAKFCLQCGTAVPGADGHRPPLQEEPEQPKPSPFSTRPIPEPPLDFIQPALAGGMFLGFLSSLPFINLANCLCCMWVLLGGGLSAVLLSRQRRSGITFGDGAFVGVLSGLFGAIVGTAISIPVQIISARMFGSQPQQLEEIMQRMHVEGPMKDWMMRMLSGEISVTTVLFTFFSYLLMWSLFAMIGGILTVAIMNKRAQTGNSGTAV